MLLPTIISGVALLSLGVMALVVREYRAVRSKRRKLIASFADTAALPPVQGGMLIGMYVVMTCVWTSGLLVFFFYLFSHL